MFKKEKEEKAAKLSDIAVDFIINYAMKELKFSLPIGEGELFEILEVATTWEMDMMDEDGKDKTYFYPEKERNEKADKFVTEMSNLSDFEIDLKDLNARLRTRV